MRNLFLDGSVSFVDAVFHSPFKDRENWEWNGKYSTCQEKFVANVFSSTKNEKRPSGKEHQQQQDEYVDLGFYEWHL